MARRSRNLQSRNRAMLGMFGPPILIFLLLVAGLYYYRENYGGSSTESAYDRAISDCVRDRTRAASDTAEQATSDCVRDTPVDGGH